MIPARANSNEPNRRVVRFERSPIPDDQKVFNAPIDISIRANKRFMTPEVYADLLIQFAPYIGQPKFSIAAHNRLIDFLCANCFSSYDILDAYRLLGANTLQQYLLTPLVQAMVTGLRLASIEFILCSLPRQFSTAMNFGSFDIRELDDRHWRFTFSDYPMHPALTQGFMQAGARVLNNDTVYEYTQLDNQSFYYDITWKIGKLRK